MINDLELYHNDWISLRIIKAPEKGIKGYVYSTETRCKGVIVSILPFRRVPEKPKDSGVWMYQYQYLLRNEVTPCWDIDQPYLSTFTGGAEHDNQNIDVIRELEEEAGYKATLEDLIYLGGCFASKSADTRYYLYSIDLTNKKGLKPKGDGSKLEARAKNFWLLEDEILKAQDPLVSVIYLRLQEYLKKPHE